MFQVHLSLFQRGSAIFPAWLTLRERLTKEGLFCYIRNYLKSWEVESPPPTICLLAAGLPASPPSFSQTVWEKGRSRGSSASADRGGRGSPQPQHRYNVSDLTNTTFLFAFLPCFKSRAGHATTLPRQWPQSCWLLHYYYIRCGYSI